MRRAFYFIKNSLVGTSASMKSLRLNLWNNVFTHDINFYTRYLWNKMEDFSTLLLGETGTGKGTAALAIGRSGFIPLDKRKKSFEESFTRSFVSLNLSQFPETLIESALFGHKKGAFTGAIENYQGVFDQCSPYGSILLDEIGEIPIELQSKMLRVLQEGTFERVGDEVTREVDVRLILATNEDLTQRVEDGMRGIERIATRASEQQPEHDQQQQAAVDDRRRGREEVVGRGGKELAHLVDEEPDANAGQHR